MTRDELMRALLVERFSPPPGYAWDSDDYQERVLDDCEVTVARRRRVLADIPDGRDQQRSA